MPVIHFYSSGPYLLPLHREEFNSEDMSRPGKAVASAYTPIVADQIHQNSMFAEITQPLLRDVLAYLEAGDSSPKASELAARIHRLIPPESPK